MSEKNGKEMKKSFGTAVSPIRSESDHTASAIGRMEALCDRIAGADEIDPADIELYETYHTQIQYEMRKGRFTLFRRLQDVVNVMIDILESDLSSGEASISPAQIRLYLTMFLDQTRGEFDPKDGPDVLVDQRQQTVINVIEVEKTYDDGRVIDIDRS